MNDDELDAVLLSLPAERPDEALRQRVLARAPKPRPAGGLWWSLGVGWATAAAAGLVLGATLPADPLAEVDQVLALDDAFYAEAGG